jgi:hypothetical protein
MSANLKREQAGRSKRIPPCRARSLLINLNLIDQLLVREQHAVVRPDGSGGYRAQLDSGAVVEVVRQSAVGSLDAPKLALPDALYANIESVDDLSPGMWVGTRDVRDPADVRQSLAGAFRFVEEDLCSGRSGLRPPQLGALHTILGYWTTKKQDPVTVVMPTGTGKTEAMLALFCAGQLERLLVVVPSDALRSQIADKFLSLGVLQDFAVVARTGLRPVLDFGGSRPGAGAKG